MHKTLVALALILSTSFATLADIPLSSTTAFGSTTAGWQINGATKDEHIGTLVTDLGDYNGDGKKDYAIAGIDVTAPAKAKVYIVLGQTSGRTGHLDLGTASATNFLTITMPDEKAPTAISGGDLNGDGVGDLVLAVKAADRVYVIYGKTGAADFTVAEGTLIEEKGFFVKGDTTNSISSIAVGDFAGDTKDDLAIGMTGWKSGVGTDEGAVCVVFGKEATAAAGGASTPAKRGNTAVDCASQTTLDAATIFEGILVTGPANAKIGQTVAVGKDIDGDGYEDLFVSALTGTTSFIVYGAANAVPAAVGTSIALTGAAGTKFLALTTAANGAITSASFIGNFNNDKDKRPELALGYPSGGTSNRGKVYVLFGTGAKLTGPVVLETMDAAVGIAYSGKDDNGYFGTALDAAGDVNGDGVTDLIVSAPLTGAARTTAGNTAKVYILYGGSTNTASVNLNTASTFKGITITGLEKTSFGVSVAGTGPVTGTVLGGDIGGDTSADFIVGAPTVDKSATVTASGAVYEFRGQLDDVPKNPSSGFRLHASLLVLASFFVALMF
jgi:hypothetical protein